jgi:hypothetical protein
MKNLSRELIQRMVDRMVNTGVTTENVTTENATTVNRSSGTQEQTRKGPDMETRLKDLEDRVAKLEALHNQK